MPIKASKKISVSQMNGFEYILCVLGHIYSIGFFCNLSIRQERLIAIVSVFARNFINLNKGKMLQFYKAQHCIGICV